MSKLFDEMAKGTAEARAYMDGKRKGYKVTPPETVSVRAIVSGAPFYTKLTVARLKAGCSRSLAFGDRGEHTR